MVRVEWIALVAHHIQHRTVSTHVQRLYPLSVTGVLQSKHLHTSFDKFVWVRHSTWVRPFTGPASLENMDCQDKIIFQSRLRPRVSQFCNAQPAFPGFIFCFDFSAALHCHGGSCQTLPSPSPRSVPSGWCQACIYYHLISSLYLCVCVCAGL